MDSRYLALRLPHLLAQVEIRLNPALRQQAFVVATGREPRSQVLGLSFSLAGEGRGAPLAAWLRRRPDLLVVEGRPERVEALLAQVRERLAAVAPGLREEGPGRFLLDLRGSRRLHPDEGALGRRLLDELREREGLLAAAGIGSTPLAARLLARRARAGELHAVAGEEERRLLDDFPLEGLPGLPGSLLARLAEGGVRRVGEARALPSAQLQRLYGEAGRRLRDLLDGLGPAAVPAGEAPPPARTRRRLPVDSADPALLEACLLDLLEVLHGRLREEDRAPRRLELALLWNDGHVQRRSASLRALPGESRRQTLRRGALAVLRGALAERRLRVRELDLSLSATADPAQLALFTPPLPAGRGDLERRERRLDQALLQVRRRWGPQAVRLGVHGMPGPGRAA